MLADTDANDIFGASFGDSPAEQISKDFRIFEPREGREVVVRLAASGPKASAATRIHEMLLRTEANELAIQGPWFQEMAKDSLIYDSKPYDPGVAEEMLRNGRFPANYNWIAARVDYLSGSQRRSRTSGKVLPREDGPEALKDAEIKTGWMKYLDVANHLPQSVSNAYHEANVCGMSWLEGGARDDPDDVPVYGRHEHWWNMLCDSCWNEPDYSDARYAFRKRAADTDMALAMFDNERFPGAAAKIKGSTRLLNANRMGGWYMGRQLDDWATQSQYGADVISLSYDGQAWLQARRSQVVLREAWIKMPTKVSRQRGTSTYDSVQLRLWLAIYCDAGLLSIVPSPYRHGRIPFVPVIHKRRMVDGAPYGMVRLARPALESFNKRMSQAQYHLAHRRVFVEKTAVDPQIMPLAQLRTEAARPDSFFVLQDGGLAKIKFEDGRAMAEGDIRFAEMDSRYISLTTGVTDENLGLQTNARSGVAIQRRQTEGAVANTAPADNLMVAQDTLGMMLLSVSEQFVTQQYVFSVDGVSGRPDALQWNKINAVDPDTGVAINDMTLFEARYVIDQQPYHATMSQQAVADLMDLLGVVGGTPGGAQVVMNLLDLLVQQMDIPNRDLVVKRIRSINGQSDPDTPSSPEEQQEQAQKQLQAQADKELLQAKVRADIARLQAQAKQGDAAAFKTTIEGMFAALQGAQVNAGSPAYAPVADAMLAAAGFKAQGGDDPNIPAGGGQPPGPPQGAPGPQPGPDQPPGGPMPDQTTMQPQEPPPPQPPEAGPGPMPMPQGGQGANQGIQTTRPD